MSDIPVQVIVAAFQDENKANEVLNELKEAKKQVKNKHKHHLQTIKHSLVV